MTINSTWIGIKEYVDEPLTSLERYGFASSFTHIPDDEDVYDCLLPDDEDEDMLIYCQLSMKDVQDIIRENPDIPVSERESSRASMCYLLFMIDLYADIYDLIDFTGAERIPLGCVELSEEPFESLDDDAKLRKPNRPWKMTKSDALKVLKFLKGRGYFPYMSTRDLLSDIPKIDLVEYLDILSKYGCSKTNFIEKIKVGGEDVFFKAGKKYYRLKD